MEPNLVILNPEPQTKNSENTSVAQTHSLLPWSLVMAGTTPFGLPVPQFETLHSYLPGSSYHWDLPHLPATLFLMFLMEMEVMSGGAGIGDTASKLNQLLSTGPDLSFRPLKLQELKLVDNTQPTLDHGSLNFGGHDSSVSRSQPTTVCWAPQVRLCKHHLDNAVVVLWFPKRPEFSH